MTILNSSKNLLLTAFFLVLASTGSAQNKTYLVRVKKEIPESTTIKVVKSDDNFNYYEVSGDELRLVTEFRMDQFRRPKLKRMQRRIEDQFGVDSN